MSPDETLATRYAVTYSNRVQDELVRLGKLAQKRGDGELFLASLKEFHRRLCIYPQFGDPLKDIQTHRGQVRLGLVVPIVMRYGVLEDERVVLAAAQPVLMPKS